ncbi:MAG: ATP-binding protein [Cellvibrionaceae bacterium]
MQITELLEKLVDDPFDNTLRSELASHYIREKDWIKAHKQYTLIKKQRTLNNEELSYFALCLKEQGFEEEAELILKSHQTANSTTEKTKALVEENVQKEQIEEKTKEPIKSSVVHITSAASKPTTANVVPIHTQKSNQIRFSDIGGLKQVKKTIQMQIIEPFINPEMFAKFGKKAGGGVLLYGPPGCGKTMIARAIAAECDAEFIPVGISDILGVYHGESEQNMSEIFEKARANKPCVLFFDELDALAFARSKTSSAHSRTLVNEFLNQLDGVGHNNDDILFLSASNMPWDVDTAMKRPGRFSRQIFVPPPDQEAKTRIVQLKLHNLPVDDFDIETFVKQLRLFSGADIDGLIEKTKELVIEQVIETGNERNITLNDFQRTLSGIIPSTEDWLRTAKNLVKFSGADRSYQDVEMYLKKNNML